MPGDEPRVYRLASRGSGVPRTVLAAIGSLELGNTTTDVHDPEDAIPSAAYASGLACRADADVEQASVR